MYDIKHQIKSLNSTLYIKLLLTIAFGFNSILFVQAQVGEAKIIQFNGVVLGEDSLEVPGAHVYSPKGRRGTSTNVYGFFTMPAIEGDSIIISAVGYKKSSYIIPKTNRETITRIFQLEIDTAFLEEIEIYPFPPTAQAFKEAILAMELPSQYRNLERTLDPNEIERIAREMQADGYSNYRYYNRQQSQNWQYMYGAQPIQLLNPFAWNQFIRSIKRGELRNND